MIYLYAIAGQFDGSLDPPSGIENQGVYQINLGSFAPVLSTVLTTTKELALSKELIYQHERVVEFYHGHVDLLPVRFNTIFDNEEALISTLNPYSLEIETNLIKVSNCVEIGVKVLVKNGLEKGTHTQALNLEQKIENTKAKKYILDKFSAYKDAFHVQEKNKASTKVIYEMLEEFSKQGHKFPIASSSHLILNSVFLVNKESINNFKLRFQNIKQEFKDFAFLLSGPWPPYSFVDFSIETEGAKKDSLCLS